VSWFSTIVENKICFIIKMSVLEADARTWDVYKLLWNYNTPNRLALLNVDRHFYSTEKKQNFSHFINFFFNSLMHIWFFVTVMSIDVLGYWQSFSLYSDANRRIFLSKTLSTTEGSVIKRGWISFSYICREKLCEKEGWLFHISSPSLRQRWPLAVENRQRSAKKK
jgi:hypothetical protein